MRQLMDGVRELAEAASGEGGQPDTDNGAGTGAEAKAEAAGDADLDFFGGQGLSPEEAAVASAASALLAQAAALVRVLARALMSAGEAPEEPEVREAWESSLFHLRQLVESADELASCAMCPPAGAGELGGAAESVATCCELLVEEVPSGEEPGGGGRTAEQQRRQELLGALRGVEAAHIELVSRVEALEGVQ
jgi:hypothetical protein